MLTTDGRNKFDPRPQIGSKGHLYEVLNTLDNGILNGVVSARYAETNRIFDT